MKLLGLLTAAAVGAWAGRAVADVVADWRRHRHEPPCPLHDRAAVGR